MITLLGGVDFEAAKLDGSTEKVRILQLPVAKFPELLGAMEDEPRMVELFCAKPKGWAETLQPPAFEQIVTKGEEINEDFFSRWLRRRLRRQERVLPGIAELVVNRATASMFTSGSSPSGPASPSSKP